MEAAGMPERNRRCVVQQTEEARRQDWQRQAGVKRAITVGHLGTPYRRPVGSGRLYFAVQSIDFVYAFEFQRKRGLLAWILLQPGCIIVTRIG
jgi:hypothetical protein